jgi:hypothetical protein
VASQPRGNPEVQGVQNVVDDELETEKRAKQQDWDEPQPHVWPLPEKDEAGDIGERSGLIVQVSEVPEGLQPVAALQFDGSACAHIQNLEPCAHHASVQTVLTQVPLQ